MRVLIAEDEPLVREGIRALLRDEADVTVVGEARNGDEALALIAAAAPDVVFLDVRMPQRDGFDVIAALPANRRPAIVFVTAFDDYAIRAFDVHAVDYLLKPFDGERFRLALARARLRILQGGTSPGDLEALIDTLRHRRTYPDRLLLRHDGRTTAVPTVEVDWIEAADNYVIVHARAGKYMVRETLKSLEDTLDPFCFARAHRSAIVNLARVQSLEPLPGGEYRIRLTSGARLTLSRGYRDRFRERLTAAR
jgi:two-component system LytT family response regulator